LTLKLETETKAYEKSRVLVETRKRLTSTSRQRNTVPILIPDGEKNRKKKKTFRTPWMREAGPLLKAFFALSRGTTKKTRGRRKERGVWTTN